MSIFKIFKSTKLPQAPLQLQEYCQTVIKKGSIPELTTIIQQKPDLLNHHSKTDKNRTFLHWAVFENHYDVVKFLLSQNGIDIEPQDIYQQTPLYTAIRFSSLEMMKLLIPYTENFNITDSNGYTPLYWAVICAELIEPGRKTDKSSEQRIVSIIECLFDCGANGGIVDKANNIPLHCAATNGYTFLVSSLMKSNGSINSQNNDGNSPLHLAVYSGHLNMVQELLENGADRHLKNTKNLTAIDLAKLSGNIPIQATFLVDKKILKERRGAG